VNHPHLDLETIGWIVSRWRQQAFSDFFFIKIELNGCALFRQLDLICV
jgi:hypothetical protein